MGDALTKLTTGWRRALTAAVLCGAVAAPMSAGAADLLLKAPAMAPADVNSSVAWLGGDFKNDVAAGYVGGIYALNGNLDRSGWLVRAEFTYVRFDFNSLATVPPGGTAHGTFYDVSGALGYQIVGGGWVASGFVGPDYQNYSYNPPAAADNRVGDRGGAIFFGRIATNGPTMFPAEIDGSYSTANSSCWARGRAGVRFDRLTLGPEVAGLGNVSFDEVRVGGFASYDVTGKVIIQANLGYADPIRGGNSAGGAGGKGIYGGATLVLLH
jgi:hypothetical protein